MNKMKQDYLSPIQIAMLVSSAIIGVVVLSLPRLAAQAAQSSAILSVFLAGIMAMVFTIIASYLGKNFPHQTIMEYSVNILGRIPGKLLGLLIMTYLVITSGITLRVFGDTLKAFMLEKTPLEFIMIAMLIVVVYLIHNGIGAIAKICESFLPIVVIVLILVVVLNYQGFEISHLRPMLHSGLMPALKGIPQLITAYLGFEIVFFVIPFMQKPEKIIPYAVAGIALPTLIYTGLVAICIGIFGLELTQKMLAPIITLARAIAFPGAFIERFDIFFGILWILGAFTSIAVYFYMASLSVTRLFGLRNFRPFIFMLLPFSYIIAISSQNVYQISWMLEIIGYVGLVIVSIPIFLLLFFWITGKGGKKHAAKK